MNYVNLILDKGSFIILKLTDQRALQHDISTGPNQLAETKLPIICHRWVHGDESWSNMLQKFKAEKHCCHLNTLVSVETLRIVN